MSQTVITTAFEQWKARQGESGEPVLLDEFVFASIPGLDPDKPIDRAESLPPEAQIVHRQAVSRTGVVNENAVVHSAVLGADVGDFTFNWIGLVNKASGTLAMIVHAPAQQKLKTKNGQQGNVLTRSFLMEYSGAQQETGISTPAETWQIDFTARMAGMDERQRLENMDIYGAAGFFGDGWLVGKNGNQYFVTKGAGYVAGLRAELAASQNIAVTTKPVKVWLDVCWTGSLTSVWHVQSKATVASSLQDYQQDGVNHYVFALASIDADGNITDLRPKGSLVSQEAVDALNKHEQSRNHPDASLTAKGFVQLSNDVTSSEETKAATLKAIKVVNDNANARLKASSNLDDLTDVNAARQVLGMDKTGNFYAVQQGGGTGMKGNKVYLGWTDSKLIAQVDSKALGELFYKDNPPTASDCNAFPAEGGAVGSKGIMTPSLIINGAPKPSVQGLHPGWNESGGLGEANLVINPGGGVGGLTIRQVDKGNTKTSWTVSIGSDGSLTFPGMLTVGSAKVSNTDGNLYGSVWDGWLSNWIPARIAASATLNGNGWHKDNRTGLMLQWGSVTRSGNQTGVIFPTAFPNVCVNVQMTINNFNYGNDSTSNVKAVAADRNGFQAIIYDHEVSVAWFAIGW